MKQSLVIITGASSGIGAALAKVFSNAGYPLGLFARNLEAMVKLNLANAICKSVDVTDFDQFREAVHATEQKFGEIDCLINNAGFARSGEFDKIAPVDHKNMVMVNILGVIHGIEIVLPEMRKRKTGTIINISSAADRGPRPTLATYAATKAAVKSLTESLRVANTQFGVRICNVAPAKIDTPMLLDANLKDEQAISSESFANAVLWMYQQPQNICVRDLVFAPTAYER